MHAKSARSRNRVSIVGMLALWLALAACGADDENDSTTGSNPPAPLESSPLSSADDTETLPEPEEPEPAFTDEGSFTAENTDGYRISVEYSLSSTGWVADPTNSVPGRTVMSAPLTTQITIANLTPQRATPTPGIAVWVLYPASTSLCQGEDVPFMTKRFCYLKLRDAATTAEGNPALPPPTLEPEQTTTFTLDGTERFSDQSALEISEAVAASTDFDNPVAMFISTSTDWTFDGGCVPLYYRNKANLEPGPFGIGDRGEDFGTFYTSDPAICAQLT
jgi:hypothetical protein